MKRFLLFFLLSMLWVASMSAQNDTTHLNFDYVSGMSILDFVSVNSGTIIAIVSILIADFVLGKTVKVKANSSVELILSWILKLFSKK